MTKRWGAALALFVLACSGGSGDPLLQAAPDAAAAPSSTSCEAAFRDACTRAQACGSDGRARVGYDGTSWVSYESGAYCADHLPVSKCGAGALQPPHDLARCLADLPNAACVSAQEGRRGLLLPSACQ